MVKTQRGTVNVPYGWYEGPTDVMVWINLKLEMVSPFPSVVQLPNDVGKVGQNKDDVFQNLELVCPPF